MVAPPLTVDGEQVLGDAGSYPVTNPARPSEVVAHGPAASPRQVDRAVRAAASAARSWGATPLEDRQRLLRDAAAGAEQQAARADLATLLTREHGKVLAESSFEVATVAAVVEVFCELAEQALAPREVAGAGVVTHEPVGVVGALLPFNWPVSVLVSKLAPALLAGNTVVVKPPPTCPTTVLALVEALAGRLPAGVLSAVSGPGSSAGEALVGHPLLGLVSLTGGARTGSAVMQSAASNLTPVLLELGGNDPAIIAPDVEPDDALADAVLEAAFTTSGQVCMAVKRLYVHEARLGQMIDALVSRAGSIVVGDGLAPATSMGPLHTAEAATRAEHLVSEAGQAGARIHRAGSVDRDRTEPGAPLVRPAIVEAPPPHAAVVAEEQFAPVLPVLPYRTLDDAVTAANDSPYGLAASIWTQDPELADAVAGALQAGTVFHNGHGPAALDPRLPFGGWRRSGIGCEYGPDGVIAYTRSRSVLAGRGLPSR